jgi:hypothetical protein
MIWRREEVRGSEGEEDEQGGDILLVRELGFHFIFPSEAILLVL